MVLQADYTTLLTKARSIEAEKSTSISTPATSVTVKSAVPLETITETQTDNLNKQMSELITIVKNQQVQMSKDQKKSNGNNYNGQDKKSKGNGNGGRNLKGPDTNSSGPFRNGAPPIQCYKCGGWGHKAFECPSPLNYRRGRLLKNKKGKEAPPSKTTNQQGRTIPAQTIQNKTKKHSRSLSQS